MDSSNKVDSKALNKAVVEAPVSSSKDRVGRPVSNMLAIDQTSSNRIQHVEPATSKAGRAATTTNDRKAG